MMENKTLADKFLLINKLNKQKLNILLRMAKLEYENKQDFEEYVALVNHFEFMCSISREKLAQITEREKSEISELIGDLNPSVLNTVNFKGILNFSEQSIILKRTAFDCGLPFLTMYASESNMQPINSMIQELLGIEAEESQKDISGELVNSYMVSDFMNSFYHSLQNTYSCDTVEETERKLLLSWKYKIIFLFRSLESRALLTKFSIPEYPHFTSDVEIRTTGLTEEEYKTYLDQQITELLKLSLSKILTDICNSNHKKIDLLDLITLKSLCYLLYDKNICNYFSLDYTEEAKEETKRGIDVVKQILIDAQKPEQNYQKNRKYPTI